MKPKYLLALGVILAGLTAAPLTAAQKPTPSASTEQQKPTEPADQPKSPLKATQEYIGIFITTALGAGVGAYLGSYLKKKGENLATREDISKLVEQVAAITQATKEIEAKISTEMWDRQKRWELKRDVMLEAAKRVAAVNNALASLSTMLSLQPQDTGIWTVRFDEGAETFINATKALEETILLVAVVSNDETRKELSEFSQLAKGIAIAIGEKDKTTYEKSVKELVQKFTTARAAIRKELEAD